ncbi:Hypothetical predicted protein [Octopus vulgaris]|uniref:Uncharacterized protein n=1 Tax=Octopus vulgaris TaxID=6645 RepID=A0AA36B8M0_OCTVU|nr:Hypothetical predicted protein [Octopus vulgaris]
MFMIRHVAEANLKTKYYVMLQQINSYEDGNSNGSNIKNNSIKVLIYKLLKKLMELFVNATSQMILTIDLFSS